MRILYTLTRLVVFIGILAVVAVAGWFIFLEYPATLTDLLGVVLALLLAMVGVRVANNVARSVAPGYNVAEVAVEGQITRDGNSGLGRTPVGAAADEIVEQVERADADRAVDALLVKLNTPGGEIVPSEDIRLAAEQFDGPTVAYATDTCASGGYEIAAGCDELWARRGSIVGSIGVIGSQVTVAELADRLGVEYEQLTAGEYKDAGVPLRELDEDEREYLQGIVDDYYDQFVADVVEGRDLDADLVRDTEARVYLGEEALDLGLVDELGTREDVTDRLEERLGTDVAVQEFAPSRGLADRLQAGSQRVAYAVGAGVADSVTGTGESTIRFR
jgi:protease-4